MIYCYYSTYLVLRWRPSFLFFSNISNRLYVLSKVYLVGDLTPKNLECSILLRAELSLLDSWEYLYNSYSSSYLSSLSLLSLPLRTSSSSRTGVFALYNAFWDGLTSRTSYLSKYFSRFSSILSISGGLLITLAVLMIL
jgi:hypothetical protein